MEMILSSHHKDGRMTQLWLEYPISLSIGSYLCLAENKVNTEEED